MNYELKKLLLLVARSLQIVSIQKKFPPKRESIFESNSFIYRAMVNFLFNWSIPSVLRMIYSPEGRLETFIATLILPTNLHSLIGHITQILFMLLVEVKVAKEQMEYIDMLLFPDWAYCP